MSDETENGDEPSWDDALNEQADSEESSEPVSDDWADALNEQAETESAETHSSSDIDLDAIMDIPVTISMEVGRGMMTIRNLLQLNQGSVVELDRLAGEPMDIFINGTLIARGEVVMINEKLGVRVTDITTPADRLKNLKLT